MCMCMCQFQAATVDSFLQSEMIKSTAAEPPQRFGNILNICQEVSKVQHAQSALLVRLLRCVAECIPPLPLQDFKESSISKEFSIEIDPNLVTAPSKRMNPPRIAYRDRDGNLTEPQVDINKVNIPLPAL